MVEQRINWEKALENRKNNAYSTWHKETINETKLASHRLSEDLVRISTKPSFGFTVNDSIFTMGSCFARRLENTLHKDGFRVPMFEGMIQNRNLFPTSISFNKYNTYSMLYELEWALTPEIYSPKDSFIELSSSKFYDLQLVATHINPGEFDPLFQCKQKIFELTSEVKKAQIIVLTLGLIEVWFDYETGRYLNGMPDFRFAMSHKDRFELRILNLQENIENLNKIYKIIAEHNDNFKMIVTVSPVPLLETFTENDIFVANTFSKSTLLTAAHSFASMYENVDYFPSYEIALNSAKGVMFEKDLRHISERGAQHIVSTFTKYYTQIE